MKDRLLKRIRAWSINESSSITDLDSNDLAQSIRNDLEKLYNTKQGTVLIDDKFGLPDFNDMLNGYGAPDSERMQSAILKLTKKYEKRLSSIEIKDEDNKQKNSNLAFRLNAILLYKNQSLPFTAGMVLNDDGSTTVSA